MCNRDQESTAEESSAVAKPRQMSMVSKNLLSAKENPLFHRALGKVVRNNNQDPTTYSQDRRQDDTIFGHQKTGAKW